MPRSARIDYPGARHHVMNRGARKSPVFPDDASCGFFVECLNKACERYQIKIHGFSLMPNHFHLMVESVFGNLSKAMALASSRYTRHLNQVYGWDGPVFRGRFHNRVVLSEEHWWYLLFYLHLNPVRARLVVNSDQWLWSSHHNYVGAEHTSDRGLVSADELSRVLEGAGGYAHLLEEIRMGRRFSPEQFQQVLFEESLRSSALQMVEKQEESPRVNQLGDAWQLVSQVTGTDLNAVVRSRRGRGGNPSRRVLCWWLAYGIGLSNAQIGEQLGIDSSTVCRLITTARKEITLGRDPVCGWAAELESASTSD